MIIGIDPKVDYAFKRVFGRDENRDILLDLINAVLSPEKDGAVVDIEILNPFNEKDTDEDKLSIVDIKARDRSGRLFNIEMQMLADRYFRQRVLYYWACIYTQQLREAEPYAALRPTISICFVNSICFPTVPDCHLRFVLAETGHGVRFNNDLLLNILELPKFVRTPAELRTPLDAWLYFLRHADSLDLATLPITLDTLIMRRALEELNMIKQSEMDREHYEGRLKAQRDILTREFAARQDGLEAGLEQGRTLGFEQGQAKQLIRRVHLCERLLQRPLSPEAELRKQSVAELERLADDLEQQATEQ